jgi:transcriptional regulator with XRE-family HTH domain
MLDTDRDRASTGIAALDALLGGLYWGDNVVWDLDEGSARPFYESVHDERAFDEITSVSLGGDDATVEGAQLFAAGPGTGLAEPADLLRAVQRRSRQPGRHLFLFESLDAMVQAWDAPRTRGFFARCCPLLLEAGAIAYWTMSTYATPDVVRDAVRAVTQCVLRVDARSIRVVKAEARDDSVAGSVIHWSQEAGAVVTESANIVGRVAASLRALRRARDISQQELARLAGVTPSAISQAERAERGLSLATIARLSEALGISIDDLLRGEHPHLYRIGRRAGDPQHGLEHAITLLGGADSELRVDLVALGPRESGQPVDRRAGSGVVAVAQGLVQVEVAGQAPAVRSGEVLVADSERVVAWRNIGSGDATLFWIVIVRANADRPHRSIV